MDVSILLSVRNRLDLTRACLESLERTTGRIRYEVILTDDASSDGTPGYLRTLPQAALPVPAQRAAPRLRRQHQRRPRNSRRRPSSALLHHDTVLLPDWLSPMLKLLRGKLDIGCVGNVQREPFSGLIDHVGIQFDAAGLAGARRAGTSALHPANRICPVASGFRRLLPGAQDTSSPPLAGWTKDSTATWEPWISACAPRKPGIATMWQIAAASITTSARRTRAARRRIWTRFRARWGARFLAFRDAARPATRRLATRSHLHTRATKAPGTSSGSSAATPAASAGRISSTRAPTASAICANISPGPGATISTGSAARWCRRRRRARRPSSPRRPSRLKPARPKTAPLFPADKDWVLFAPAKQ